MSKNPGRDIRSYFNVKPVPPKQQSASTPSLHRPAVAKPRANPVPAARPAARPTPTPKAPVNPPTTAACITPEAPKAESVPPTTSQSSTNSTGTKRVVSNGETVVLNSDSDTDSDGLIELELDLVKPSTMARDTASTSQAVRSAPYIELLENGLRRPSDKHKQAKPSLNKYAKEARERAETERSVAEAKAELEKPIEQTEFLVTEEALAGHIDGDDDGDTAKRLFQAMQRTHALDTKCVFHLFHETPRSFEEPPFPADALPQHGWASRFEESSGREQAFASGFAQQIFEYQQLPVELASWMIDQLCLERNEILSTKYLQLLQAHSHHLRTLIDHAKLDEMLKLLGADLHCIDRLQQIVPSYEHESSLRRQLPVPLKWVVLLLQISTLSLPSTTNTHALYLLLHLCFEDSVMSDAGALNAVQDTIEWIMRNIPNDELTPVLNGVVPSLLERITHPILQHNLVRSLPTKSPFTAYFQRHLALSFLLHPSPLRYPLSSPKIPILIHNLLRTSPDFKVTNDTDHSSLAARVSLLDIAIGPGPMTVPYTPPCPTSSQELPAPASNSSEEQAFNKEVDALANHVKLLSNSIVELGAIDDLTRLDAKDCCEKLYHRLENAVRIGGRKSTNAFDNEKKPISEASKNVFKSWLGRVKGESGSSTPTNCMGHLAMNETDVNGASGTGGT